MSTTASINAKGANGTGITDDLIKSLHDNLGKTVVAVVEIRSESRGENIKGDEKVNLAIQTIEVAPDGMTAAHLRELAQAFHYERKLNSDGEQIDYPGDGPAPKVSDVLAEGAKHKPHAFEQDPDEDDEVCCLVCGSNDPDAPVHADASKLADPFSIGATAEDDPEPDGDGELPDPDDPAYEPHDFIPDADGNCDDGCGQPADAPIHSTADVDADTEAPVPA